jgi:glycerophosphoryl diester phosphodiesterase
MLEPARDTWSRAIHRLLAAWRPTLATHLAFATIAVILLAPLAGVVGRLALALSGNEAVADQDIARFLLSPIGLGGLVLVAALTVLVLLLEQASQMALGAMSLQEHRPVAHRGISFGLGRFLAVFVFALRLVARVLALVLPVLGLSAGIAWFLLGEHDINFYLSSRPPEFIAAAGLIGALATGGVVILVRKLLDWAMALPLVVFGGVAPAASFGQSTRLMQGRRARLLLVLAKWAAVAIVLGIVVTLLAQLLASVLLPGTHDRIRLFVPALGVVVAFWVLGNLLVTAFNAGAFAQIIVDVYERCGPLPDVPGGEADADEHGARNTTLRRVGVLLVLLVVAVGTGLWLMSGMVIADRVDVVAHRGAAGSAPENTLAAVRQAIEDGADWVEIDVQETADGEVVVIHDSDFMKLAGVPLKIWEGSFEQIREIDIGSWYSPVFAAERVPTLREVLDAARGQAKVVIELKYYGHDVDLEQRVVDIVEAAGMVDEVAIMALKYAGLEKIRALRPDWRIGLLSAKALGDLTKLDVDFLAVNMGMATSRFLSRARAAGKPVYVWTVNSAVDLSRMASLGVTGVITDEPALARSVLADRTDLSVPERLLIHTAVLFGRPPPARTYRDESP